MYVAYDRRGPGLKRCGVEESRTKKVGQGNRDPWDLIGTAIGGELLGLYVYHFLPTVYLRCRLE